MARALHCNVNVLESVGMAMKYPDRAIKMHRPCPLELSVFEIAINAMTAK
jgi:hypothetical protein